MQLQKSLFSFYKIFILKIPILFWIILATIFTGIIIFELNSINNNQPLNQYEECFIKYYNLTRSVEQLSEEKVKQDDHSKNNNLVKKQNKTQQQNNKITVPLNLTSQYYNFLNSTTKLKLYFIKPNELNNKQRNQFSCKIILNTQLLRNDSIIKEKNKSQEVKLGRIISKNYNQVNKQQYSTLSSQHPFIHLTANQRVMYLDNNYNFQQNHGIKNHAIFLQQPQINIYPTFLGISSKLWRFHYNDLMQSNQQIMHKIVESLLKTNQKIKQIFNQTKQENLIKLDKQKQNKTNKQNQNTKILNAINNTLIYPLQNIFLYFHYPQSLLRSVQLQTIFLKTQFHPGFIYNLFYIVFFFVQLSIISCIIGLFVRFLFFLIISIYLFLGGCFINKQWGWVYKYFNLIRNRQVAGGAANHKIFTNLRMLAYFMLAFLGIMLIFSLGTKYIMSNLYVYAMSFNYVFYSQMFLKNFFFIQLFFYVCCRSRLSIRYFPQFSLFISIFILLLNLKYFYYNISYLLNLHLLLHFLLITIFICFQSLIGNTQFKNNYTPSQEKPRLMYYAGYDISWQNTLPPIWTYFTSIYDFKYFSQSQKSLIQKDYQLLYGRLLGMNQRQQLPQNQEDQKEEQNHHLNQNFSQSNQMSLIH